MRLPIPGFVPVPGPETMHMISILSLIAGICLVGGAALFLFLKRGEMEETRKKRPWIVMGIGALLILNHAVQLLF